MKNAQLMKKADIQRTLGKDELGRELTNYTMEARQNAYDDHHKFAGSDYEGLAWIFNDGIRAGSRIDCAFIPPEVLYDKGNPELLNTYKEMLKMETMSNGIDRHARQQKKKDFQRLVNEYQSKGLVKIETLAYMNKQQFENGVKEMSAELGKTVNKGWYAEKLLIEHLGGEYKNLNYNRHASGESDVIINETRFEIKCSAHGCRFQAKSCGRDNKTSKIIK